MIGLDFVSFLLIRNTSTGEAPRPTSSLRAFFLTSSETVTLVRGWTRPGRGGTIWSTAGNYPAPGDLWYAR